MIDTDKDALECDLAEVYRIYDLQSLPLQKVAMYACGLRDDSRIMMSMSGSKIPTETMLLASAVDQLNFIAWSKTEGAQHGEGRPNSIVNALLNPQEKETESFTSAEEFEAMRRQLLGE